MEDFRAEEEYKRHEADPERWQVFHDALDAGQREYALLFLGSEQERFSQPEPNLG